MPIIIELAQGLLRRFAPWIVIAALVLAMAIAGPAACRKLHTDQARARLGEEQARAASKSGENAVAAVGAAAKREQQSDQMGEDHEKEIRGTAGADAPVAPAVRDVGLGSLCGRAAYRDSERCRLRRPATR